MAQPKPRMTPAEYLALERQAETRSEFLDGEIFAMAGASARHVRVCAALTATLWNQLVDRPCDVLPTDMRVKIPATGLYTYPDVAVVCGEAEYDDAEHDTLLNPTLLIEVLSPPTADYDLGAKFGHYRTLPSLREVLYVAQSEVHVLHYRRQSDGTWLLSETRDPDAVVELPSIGAELRLAQVYSKARLTADR
ncbi:MAG: Uma2 family endonuclease [Thermoanaerobaculia bacterium]|nr:Uma2 family endonuclease [Thermoanaerobaculia bacterium]